MEDNLEFHLQFKQKNSTWKTKSKYSNLIQALEDRDSSRQRALSTEWRVVNKDGYVMEYRALNEETQYYDKQVG